MIYQRPLIVALIQLARPFMRSSLGLIFFVAAGCTTITSSQWDQRYGKATPREITSSITSNPSRASPTYYGDTKHILEQRCVVCHGCYDAPCQLKLEAYEGLLRGANPSKVYEPNHQSGRKTR